MVDAESVPEPVVESAVLAAINTIVDPCSAAVSLPVGLVDLGLVQDVRIDHGSVAVEIVTTAPRCLYVGHFREMVEDRVRGVAGVAEVTVHVAQSDVWDESMMLPAAREAMSARVSARRRALTLHPTPPPPR
ncbi:iron-sulfur cluster assembly protein [Microbacterium sp. X-17]|uniref:metal-sulfur cluster assembly factor n=1 Tax=Microbacterium sp. X-17 TaxID=3144404 RepID=UPI0031F5AB96